MDLSNQIILSEKIPQEGSSSGSCSKLASRRDAGREIVVGFDDDARKLVEQLMGAKKQLQIISIVGMVGLGKTTLARKVYNDPSIVYHFYVRAWTYVTQAPRNRDLLLGILRSGFDYEDGKMSDEESSETPKRRLSDTLSDEELCETLKRRLSGQRYLIVMDDIWDIRAWNDLKWSFPDNKNGSRIIFTSRLADLPLPAHPESYQHHLRFLSDQESWDLFQHKVFRKESCPSWLVEIGMNITRKCQGLPLAIVLVAGLLANDITSYWWRQVARDTSNWFDPKQYMDTLALSYNHLPHHLKPCFLYFAAFPEDYEIPVWKLIFLWVAEGFIHKTGEANLEDVAADYLKDLINRSLVIVAKRGSDGGIKACIVHDLLRDLCLTKAHEENFLQRLERYMPYLSHFPSESPLRTMPRRLCIHSPDSFETITMPSSQNVQSILFSIGWMDYTAELWKKIMGFKDLRVLDLSSMLISTFPSEIVKLEDLRYIALRAEKGCIPASISDLQHLETFIVSILFQRYIVPGNILKMVKLRHLILSGKFYFEGAESSYVLENLQTLLSLDPYSKSTEEILKRTPNLRKLHIRADRYDSLLIMRIPNLDKLNYLEKLKLESFKFSPYMLPESLKKLTLIDTQLTWNEIQKIGMLPTLEVLKLKDDSCFGGRWETSDGGFRRLKYLELDFLDVVHWHAHSEHFPNLVHLKLDRCYQLEEIPLGLGDIYTLEIIEVSNCYRNVRQSAYDIKEDQEAKGNDLLKILIHRSKLFRVKSWYNLLDMLM